MSQKYDGKYMNDKDKRKVMKDALPEGDLLVSEGPDGDMLWKKKKKLNEQETEKNVLNE